MDSLTGMLLFFHQIFFIIQYTEGNWGLYEAVNAEATTSCSDSDPQSTGEHTYARKDAHVQSQVYSATVRDTVRKTRTQYNQYQTMYTHTHKNQTHVDHQKSLSYSATAQFFYPL